MADLAGVQEAYEQLLQQATAQFEQTVQAATLEMQRCVKEAAAAEAAALPPPKEEPKAEMRDGGLWLNGPATAALMETLETTGALVEELSKQP